MDSGVGVFEGEGEERGRGRREEGFDDGGGVNGAAEGEVG